MTMNPNNHRVEMDGRFEDVEQSVSSLDGDDYNDNISEQGSAVGHSLPSPEEVKVDGTSSRRRPWLCLAVTGALVILVVGLSVGLTVGRDGRDGSGVVRLSAAEKAKRRRHAKEFLVHHGVSSADDFDFAGTPQNRALEFVAADDHLRLDVPRKSSDDHAYDFVTRYVLAVVYYATAGPTWHHQLKFLSQRHSCEWFTTFREPVGRVGVLCDERTKSITGISMLYNNLRGNVPEELGALTTMTYVEFVGNDVEGTLPQSFRKLTNMDSLVMANNYIAGSIPEWIGELDKMKFLYLSNNVMTGSVPSGITKMTDLIVAGLDDNDFVGSANFVWKFPKLRYVFLEKNRLTGSVPDLITQTSPDLINLDLSENDFDGDLPKDLFRLSNLKILDLHGNQFTGGVPDDINDNRALQFLALYRNKLSGAIPPSIGNLRNLTHLDLSYNQFQGDIPSEFSELSGLTYLFLAENPTLAAGPIPTYFYGYKKLRELSLKNTNRNGKIEGVVSFLPELVLLDLDDNQLTGAIPTEMGDMPSLEFLLLNRNKLSGEIPTQLAKLSGLKFFLVNTNDLKGDMRPICMQTEVTLAMADCDELSCSCCTCCYDGQDCHENTLVANLDPTWERAYERTFYKFSNTTDGRTFEEEGP